MEKWGRLLRESNILVNMQARRSFDAIRELAALFQDDAAVPDLKKFVAGLIRREKQSSTGVGNGVAVPHLNQADIRRQLLAVGISRQGIEFNAVDGQPVHIVTLLATPGKHQAQHMELLADVARLLKNEGVRQALLEAEDAARVLQVFKDHSHLS